MYALDRYNFNSMKMLLILEIVTMNVEENY